MPSCLTLGPRLSRTNTGFQNKTQDQMFYTKTSSTCHQRCCCALLNIAQSKGAGRAERSKKQKAPCPARILSVSLFITVLEADLRPYNYLIRFVQIFLANTCN